MYVRQKPFQGFGWVLETIIGVAQLATQGTATAIQHDKVKKAQRKQSKVLDLLHQQRLEEIKAEGDVRDELLRVKNETSLTEEAGMRTATYLGVSTAVIVSIVLIYFIFRSQNAK